MHAAVLGHPISHSLSPILHNAAYRALGLDWQYEAIDVEPGNLPELLTDKLLNQDDWVGFSVTMPLKPEIVPWLNSIAKQIPGTEIAISPLVTATGAANTLVKLGIYPSSCGPRVPDPSSCGPRRGIAGSLQPENESNAYSLIAENTDVAGIVAAIREIHPSGSLTKIAILGAGATAASALAAAQELGAKEIAIYTRASTDLKPIREVAARLGITFAARDIAAAATELPEFDAVISTMPKHAADPIAAKLESANGVLLDVIYDPRPTALQKKWSELGGKTVSGERMLLHQAARQVELMTGQKAPLKAMERALAAVL